MGGGSADLAEEPLTGNRKMPTRNNLLLVTLIAACGNGEEPVRVEDLRAPRLVQAIPKPGFLLTRTDGTEFDFRRETAGTLTFLFFGYTNCPDVCPLHMGNIAAVLDSLPPEVSRQVRFVFVTTDPDRDTPERLGSWLAEFDSTFIGLTGTPAALETAQRSVGALPARREGTASIGGYSVSHAAQLFAFTPDDSAHVVYPWGVQRQDFISDIPKLLRLYGGRRPSRP